jgi:hypothetical protein
MEMDNIDMVMEIEGQRDIEMEMEMEVRNGDENVNGGIEMVMEIEIVMEIEMVMERRCLTWHGKKVCTATASSIRDPRNKRLGGVNAELSKSSLGENGEFSTLIQSIKKYTQQPSILLLKVLFNSS